MPDPVPEGNLVTDFPTLLQLSQPQTAEISRSLCFFFSVATVFAFIADRDYTMRLFWAANNACLNTSGITYAQATASPGQKGDVLAWGQSGIGAATLLSQPLRQGQTIYVAGINSTLATLVISYPPEA